MICSVDAAPTRRALLGALGCAAAALAAPSVARAAWHSRRLRFSHLHTDETLDVTYYEDGVYYADALGEINHFMRDWRRDEVKRVDVALLDLIADVHQRLDCGDTPFRLICGYRSPETNAMLRRRSRGVARRSLHLEAKAVDISLEGRSARDIQRAGLAVAGGGVGLYSRSGFVHLDTGPVRRWGR